MGCGMLSTQAQSTEQLILTKAFKDFEPHQARPLEATHLL